MDALWAFVENAAILIAGLATRFAVALALLALLVAVLLPFLYAGEGIRRLWRRLEGFASVAGLAWRRRTYYAPSHAWLRLRAGRLRIGLDDLAGRLLRRVDAVLLPAVGTHLKEGDPLLTVGRGRREVVIPSPIEGTVRHVNGRLLSHPDSLVTSPYERGWLVDVDPATDGYRKLRHDEEAAGWMLDEATRLSHALEHATGVMAADGGELMVPAHLAVNEKQLELLACEFLAARAQDVETGSDSWEGGVWRRTN
jgi:glycine cleavage system H lipoate-binding protein